MTTAFDILKFAHRLSRTRFAGDKRRRMLAGAAGISIAAQRFF
jgi:hypothetical protein